MIAPTAPADTSPRSSLLGVDPAVRLGQEQPGQAVGQHAEAAEDRQDDGEDANDGDVDAGALGDPGADAADYPVLRAAQTDPADAVEEPVLRALTRLSRLARLTRLAG